MARVLSLDTIQNALSLPTVPYLATIGHAFNLIIGTFDELIAVRHEQKKEEDDGTAPPHP